MQIMIEISDKVYGLLKYFEKALGLVDKKEEDDDVKTALMRAVVKGTPLPKGHGDLIDRNETLNNAWKKFYEQEDEHEKNIDDYDLTRDRFYEQSGFECCQQVLVNASTIIGADKEE